jgi:hypothetical protein
MLFLHCTRDVLIRDLATISEDEVVDRSYIWEARRHSMRPLDKPSGWRS